MTITVNLSKNPKKIMSQKKIGGRMNMETEPRERLESKAELLNAIKNWLWQERIAPEELQELIQQVKENPIPF